MSLLSKPWTGRLFDMTIANIKSHRGTQKSDSTALQLMLRVAELAAAVERCTGDDGEHVTAVAELTLLRLSAPCQPVHLLHRPALCLIVQGAKHMHLADELYAYDASTYLVIAQHLPVMAHVVEASMQTPYLCVRLDFNPVMLAQHTITRATSTASIKDGRSNRETASTGKHAGARGLFVGNPDLALIDAILRLIQLLETPHDVAVLAPLIMQEIIYRLLASENGWRLEELSQEDSRAHRIAQAIAWLRQHFATPLKIDDLARIAHMSTSSLHHHFKAVTAMSPLQYQKRIRLCEARTLLLSGIIDAASAGYRVGYDSPSQFSREYSRLFGAPPARDLRALRDRNS
jgi:AraC-like DNA-binding protein